MDLKAKILNPAQTVVLYEMLPPKAGDAKELETLLTLAQSVAGSVDGINIPEIREELRNGAGRRRLPERIEPRAFAQAIQESVNTEAVVNRVTVREAVSEQRQWLRESFYGFGVRNLILVGGESHTIHYPGPSVAEAASLAAEESLEYLLGGITIPSRSHEVKRIRSKYACGLRFFTTQVLLDSNDIVDLVQGLNGLDIRILLSFAPISHLRDLEFLRWLGVDIPQDVPWVIQQTGRASEAVEKSIALASKILTDVLDRLPEHPPGIGINVEQITRRNAGPSQQMLAQLGSLYRHLWETRHSPPPPGKAAASGRPLVRRTSTA